MCPAVQEISDNKPVPLCSPRVLVLSAISFAIPRAARNSFVFPSRSPAFLLGAWSTKTYKGRRGNQGSDSNMFCQTSFGRKHTPPLQQTAHLDKKKRRPASVFFSRFPGSASAGIHGRGANLLFFVPAEETRLASPHIYCAWWRRAGDSVRLINPC